MSINKYTLIPVPREEVELRKRFPWVGNRPLLIPTGWVGLVHSTCAELEAILTPDKPSDVVQYFFATVRDSRLRIFIRFKSDFENEVRSDAINTLMNEVQINCDLICSVCGKEITSSNRYSRGTLPDCGQHEDGESENTVIHEIDSELQTVVIEVDLTHAIVVEKDESKTVSEESEVASNVEEATASLMLYDVSTIRNLLAEAATRYRDRDDVSKVKAVLNKLIKSGGERQLKPLPDNGVTFLDQLEADFPNFKEVIEMLKGFNALSSKYAVTRIPAMLLLGSPGVGKTLFAEALAKGMQVPFKVVRMENQQAGAGLVGSSDFWSNSKQGAVFNVLTSGDCGNPVVVIDEVDKAANDSRYSPINGLYSLLEPSSARSFSDESLPDISIDASRITWVLTANDEKLIPDPILSRVRVFDIPCPDQFQSAHVARRIYQLILDESPTLRPKFTEILSDEVTNALSVLSPRKMRLAIETALGRAALAKRNTLIVEDFDVVMKVEKMKIGFL